MTTIMTTLMPFYEEIMTVFCTDNMTNNIQYGVTSHYLTDEETRLFVRLSVRLCLRWILILTKSKNVELQAGCNLPHRTASDATC